MAITVPSIRDGDWVGVRKAFQRLTASTGLGPDSTPTYAGLTLTGLTDNSLIYSNSDVLTSLGAATDGQIPIGDTDGIPILATITGTAKRVTVTNGAGTIALSGPQDLDTVDSPIFAGATIGSVAIPGVYTAQEEPTGFADRTATLSWDDGTYTLTITGNHDIYIHGVKTTKGTDSIQIADATDLYWIYYDAAGTLTSSTTHPGFDLPLMASVYWNTTIDKGLAGEERHGIVMDWSTHRYLHETIGSRYESGLAGTFDNTTLQITTGEWHDEDIEHTPAQQTTCNVLYKNGSAVWEWDAEASVYYKLNGANLRYNNGNVLADCDSNKYMAMWIFATNDITTPTIALMGQRQDTLIANARANNTYESLSLGELPFAEMKLLYRVILRNTGTPPTWIENADYRSVANVPSGTYVATSHSTLTGLTNDDHTQYILADGTRALAGAWDMGSQALTNVNIDSGVITGITDLAVADGGTGQSTAQAAINALTAVAGGGNEHILTKDTGTSNAVWKANAATDAFTVKIDVGATADYIGAASSDGVLRTGTGLSYTDGGNFVTLGLDIGTWTTPTFDAGDFTASGAMTWTVAEADAVNYQYMIIGKTMYVNFYVQLTTVGGTPSTELRIAIPASKTCTKTSLFSTLANDAGGGNTAAATVVQSGETWITCYKDLVGTGNWSAATNTTGVFGSIVFEID